MMTWVSEFIWSGTLALGFQFLYVGYRVRFDRTYAWFGFSLIFLAILFAEVGGSSLIFGVSEAQVTLGRIVILAMLPALVLFFFHLTEASLKTAFAAFLACDAITALTFAAQVSLRQGRMMPSRTVPMITWSGGAYAFSVLFGTLLISLALGMRVRASPGTGKPSFLLLAGAWAIMTLALLSRAVAPETFPPSWMVLSRGGLALFTVTAVRMMIKRFLSLYQADRESLRNLEAAFGELQESSRHRELGTSAAVISHEIRNYAATLKGNAILLRKREDMVSHREEADRIRITADRMEAVSRDIAAYTFSQAELPTEQGLVSVEAIARECIRHRFPDRQSLFRLHAFPNVPALQGDSAKLEQVFMNLFKNALEAGAGRVDVRFTSRGSRLIVAVEDDGVGCAAEELDKLTEPFFSGKRDGGTGLGCAIAESILAAHGASMRSYSKNALASGNSGLVVNLVFPIGPAPDPGPRTDNILVVSEDPRTRNNIVLPMIHIGLRPLVLPWEGGAPDWKNAKTAGLLFMDQAMADNVLPFAGFSYTILVDRNRRAFIARPEKASPDGAFLFTEESLAGLIQEGAAA